jgi:hypothetical protein
LKAVLHIVASSAETIGAFNTGFDTVNLHRPTVAVGVAVTHVRCGESGAPRDDGGLLQHPEDLVVRLQRRDHDVLPGDECPLHVAAQVEFESKLCRRFMML